MNKPGRESTRTRQHADINRPGGRRRNRAREQTAGQLLGLASLKQNAVVEDIDMKAPRGFDKALFHKLVAGEWIERYQNLLIIDAHRAGDMIQYLPTLLIF